MVNLLNEGLPEHIAIIMDGNGRWATNHNLPRFRGHLEGVKRVEEITEEASKLGVKVLTIFAFSTENWQRPATEVDMLMKTLCTVLQKRIKRFLAGNIRLRLIGRRESVPKQVLSCIDAAIEKTKNNTGMVLNLAFNYGARAEITDAFRKIMVLVKEGKMKIENFCEENISQHLYTSGQPDPDLLIRTSGEKRISNFLLWQLSYTEIYFTNICWPDFKVEKFHEALQDYQRRERRYGRIVH